MKTRLVAVILFVGTIAIAEEPVPQIQLPNPVADQAIKPPVEEVTDGVTAQSKHEQDVAASATAVIPIVDAVNAVNGDVREPYKLGTVLEGSSLATFGQQRSGHDQHSERLCETAESLLNAASRLGSLPDNRPDRARLIDEMRKEAAACLREAGY